MRGSALLSIAALLFVVGCATPPKPVIDEAMTAEELHYRLVQSAASADNFSAEGSITINTPKMNQSAGFDLLTRGKDSVKMTVYGPFGITVGAALITRTHVTAYNALNNTVYQGDPRKQLQSLPLMKDIPFELLISSLQGNHPFLRSAVIDSFTVEAGRFYTFISSVNDTTYDKFIVDEGFLRIIQCTRRTSLGTALWKVEYAYKRNTDGAVVPEQVKVFVPAKESMLQLDYDTISHDVSSVSMKISYPEDAEIITIE